MSLTPIQSQIFKFYEKCGMMDVSAQENEFADDTFCIRVLQAAERKFLMWEDKAIAASSSKTRSKIFQSKQEDQLFTVVADVEKELRQALTGAEDLEVLKFKFTKMRKRFESERGVRIRCEEKSNDLANKLTMVSDHMEKLVKVLARESTVKIQCIEELRKLRSRYRLTEQRSEKLRRKNLAFQKLVAELREGSKILADQLRLMDDKFADVKGKLAYSRRFQLDIIEKTTKERDQLKIKLKDITRKLCFANAKFESAGSLSFDQSWSNYPQQSSMESNKGITIRPRTAGVERNSSTTPGRIKLDNTFSTCRDNTGSQHPYTTSPQPTGISTPNLINSNLPESPSFSSRPTSAPANGRRPPLGRPGTAGCSRKSEDRASMKLRFATTEEMDKHPQHHLERIVHKIALKQTIRKAPWNEEMINELIDEGNIIA